MATLPSAIAGHPAAGRKVADLARIEWGLGGKVEAIEVAHAREVNDLHGHLDAPFVLARDSPLDEEGERLAHGKLAPRRLVDEIVELITNGGELEKRQPAGQ
jgi:hypothetical protein